MAVIADNNKRMFDCKCAAEAIYEGYVYKDDGSAQMTVITAKGDTAVAVAAYSSLDPQDGTAATKTAGDHHAFCLLGSKMTVGVASVASQTWQFGAKVYLDDSVDGMVTVTAATSRPIGHYVGKDALVTSTSDGDLIPVYLDIAIGASTV